ncbi:hypothetical protein DNU06_01510 [Putridiphycobacter roseus]|uniref:Secretion system C-terminal sorting domain-containing protein n=1 Tax=Putridiphycobacter roseus TaxID=2219161 RepID=A0A2W1N2K8_9FLAO|nr:GEVED domain-containing protein [Putridiphycobacter roseus]PZE18537.1 hypothetical protein DNU06_01510 [Putridiphycobacter roseus]
MIRSLLLISIVFAFNNIVFAQPLYKVMMEDNQFNFYQVVDTAESYFNTHPRTKGSGWKGFQRWIAANEYKYYPSGDRTQTSPFFAEENFTKFKEENSNAEDFFNSGWQDLGPYSIDSITGHYSAGLGRVEDFYVNPNNTQLIYLGSRSGGFWRSTDGGGNWLNSTDFLVATGVDAIAVSPTNPDSVLVNVKNARNGTTHGVYRSVDGGITWNVTNFNPINLGWGGLGTNDKIYKIAYHPTIPNLVFVGTSKGIFKSTDNLQTWTQALSTSDITDIDFHPTNTNILYLYDDYYWGVNQNVVLKSTDLGATYTSSNQITGNNDAKLIISLSADCPSCVYVASGNGIWKSTDEGQNFNYLNNPGNSCDGFAVNDLDTSKMIYGYLDIEGSIDGGQSFSQITFWSQGTNASFNNGLYVHADLRDAKCINGTYYVATDGFLSRSLNNGITWEILSQGTGIRENYSLGISQSNHYRTMVGSQDNGTSIKHKNDWIEFYGADGMEAIIHPLNDDWMIGSIQYGSRRITKNGGATQGGATPTGQSGSWIAPLMYDPNDHMTVYSLGENIYKSTDFGTSWVNIGSPSFTGTIAEAAIAQNNSNTLIVSKASNIEITTDAGITFTDISNGLPNNTITDIAFDPHNDQVIIVTFATHQNDNNKVFLSNNQGATWTNISYNIQNMPIRKVVIDHSPEANIYLGAEIGVFTKPMNGNSWTLYNVDLPNIAIEDMEIMWGSNTLRAATWGRGLWEYALVGRSDYPAIIRTKITDTPSDILPTNNTPQYVTSIISYDNNITSAYVKYAVNNQVYNNTLTMSNTIDSTWVTNNPIPAGLVNDKIYFKVYAIGTNNDTTETYKFMYTMRPSCLSSGNMSWGTAITEVGINTILNSSGKTQPYTDYSSTQSTNLLIGNNYDLSVNLNTDGNYSIYAKAWIDWNQNGSYLDTGEEYDLGFTLNATNGITSNSPLSITVPSTALIGNTSMRVSAKFNASPTPCETDFDGEVEDYQIKVDPLQLDFITTNQPSCIGDVLYYEYTGDPVDSVYWEFTNGSTVYSGNTLTDNIVFNAIGLFDFTLYGYYGGVQFSKDSLGIVNIVGYDSITIFDTICLGEIYPFNSQQLTTTGTYIATFTTPTCDSIVTLHLSATALDVSVDNQNTHLIANSTVGTYQWYDCKSNMIIAGANNSTYTPIMDGAYALILNYQNCADTSDCIEINGLNIPSNGETVIKIYPNPFENTFTIELDNSKQPKQVKVYNASGKVVLIKQLKSKDNIVEFDLTKHAKGIYFIHVISEKSSVIQKLIKY